MQTAATEGTASSPGFGLSAFAHRAPTLPGVSAPSSVVRSMHRMARSSAHSLDCFLIERLARAAARSSAPTWSTDRTPRISEPRCARDTETAIARLSTERREAPPRTTSAPVSLEAVEAVDRPAPRGNERDLRQPSAAVADHVVHGPRGPGSTAAVALPACVAALHTAARLVLQPLRRVELLLPHREHELPSTVTAVQQLVNELNHCPLLGPLSVLPPAYFPQSAPWSAHRKGGAPGRARHRWGLILSLIHILCETNRPAHFVRPDPAWPSASRVHSRVMLPEYAPGARSAVRTCLNVGPDDRVAVVRDGGRAEIAAAIVHEAGAAGAQVVDWTMEEWVSRPAREFPGALAEEIRRFRPTVSFFVGDGEPGELAFRKPMLTLLAHELRCRHGHMIG